MLQWVHQYQHVTTLLFAGAVAVATVVYAALTWKLVAETRRMREAQTDPKLAAFFEPIEEFVNFGHLYIQNIGLGPAYDISFALRGEGSVTGANMLIRDFSTTKFFERGVKYLGPGQKVRSGYTSFPEGYAEKIKAVVVVEVRYRNSTGRKHREAYRIDFSEIEGLSQLGTPHLYSIAKSLEKLQSDIHHLTTGFRKLKVDVYDSQDREHEQADARERMEQRKQAQSAETGGTPV